MMMCRSIFAAVVALAALERGVHAAVTTAFVDFSRPSSPIPARAFGVNAYQIFSDALPNRSGYVSNVATMLGGTGTLGGFARLHREDMMTRDAAVDKSSWLNFNGAGPGLPDWNYTRVDAALSGMYFRGNAGVPVLLCFSAFPPAWANSTNGNKSMSEAFESDWVSLTVRLVTHLRTTLGGELPAELMWLEFTNEWDASGYAPASLGRLVVATAAAARAAWPGVRVGGPAWARPDITSAVTGFLAVAGPHIDFVSYHAYCTGNANQPLSSIFGCAGDPFVTRWMVANVALYAAKGSTIALLHDEMNISWNPPDVRMTNAIGACFDAIWGLASVAAGVSGVSRWNEADGWYGALNNDAAWTPRPPAFIWNLLNTRVARLGASPFLVASAASTANATVFAAIADATAPSKRNFVIIVINTSGANATVALDVVWAGAAPAAGTAVDAAVVTDAGLALGSSTIGDITSRMGVTLVPNAVAFWSFSL